MTAQWKKNVKLCSTPSDEQEKEQMRRCEIEFKGLESLLEDSLNCHGRLDKELSEQFNLEKYSRFACNYMTIKENAKYPIGFTRHILLDD